MLSKSCNNICVIGRSWEREMLLFSQVLWGRGSDLVVGEGLCLTGQAEWGSVLYAPIFSYSLFVFLTSKLSFLVFLRSKNTMTKCPLPIGSESFSAVKHIRYESIFIFKSLHINKAAVLTLVRCQTCAKTFKHHRVWYWIVWLPGLGFYSFILFEKNNAHDDLTIQSKFHLQSLAVGDFYQIKRLPSLSWRLSAVWWLNLWQLDPWLDPYCALTGEAYIRLNKLTEAEHWYRESLRAKPDHIPAHLTYGKLLAMTVWLHRSLPFFCKLISWEIKPTSYHSVCKCVKHWATRSRVHAQC